MQTMKAPMAGVFYQSPSPEAEPFVSRSKGQCRRCAVHYREYENDE